MRVELYEAIENQFDKAASSSEQPATEKNETGNCQESVPYSNKAKNTNLKNVIEWLQAFLVSSTSMTIINSKLDYSLFTIGSE
ncbi:hypothetical protein [Parasitella parasitica]|uniref:Uncharacterized protein n=1 Tax=Parasitella parasitica TaxID=35722 RepID=A0A0B7N922_9FUNG|nr:hypothetical protein [Parasitella parasitica]